MSRVACLIIGLLTLAGLRPGLLHAQQAPEPAQAPLPATTDLIRVFLDCDRCDTDYLRQNVGFVDYVRDRESSDFHVLVTTQSTGSDGLSWRVRFIGFGRFAARDETLTFTTASTDSNDDRRKAFARIFKLGLASFAAGTSAGSALDVTWKSPTEGTSTNAPAKDPWNYWVFSVGTNGNANGERSSSSVSYNGNVSANRTTDAVKISFNVGGNLRKSSFEVGEGSRLETETHSWNVSGRMVKSLSPRWSVGGTGSVSASSFSNNDRSIGGAPAIEFDFFPYSESSRRSLTVQYAVGATKFQYRDLTIFDKLEEVVPRHAINGVLNLRQPWGSLGVHSSYSQHLAHPDRYRASIFGDADVRLFKGFSFNVFGEYERINDQISLKKENASQEEILLRLRQLATGYSYFVAFGINYRFGSIFNSVVNPRMNSSSF